MRNFVSTLRAGLVAAAVAVAMLLPAHKAEAQLVTQLPVYVDNNPSAVKDLGNGPVELRLLTGAAQIWTMQGSGVSTAVAASTTMVLQSTAAATPPCVGCVISGTGITTGTTVTAFNGTTTITLSAAMTVANGTAVSWGMACPSSIGSNPAMSVRAGADQPDIPLYTGARICATSQNAQGAAVLPFPIGAH